MAVAMRIAPICGGRSEEHTSELQSRSEIVCRLLLEKTKAWAAACARPFASRAASCPPPRVCCERAGGRHRCQRRRVFFFNDTATTEIYTLSLHDALPI